MSVPCCRCLLPCFTLPLDAQLPPTPLKLVSFLQESFRPAGPQAGCRPRWVISTLGGAITCAVQRGRWACRRSSAVGESCIFFGGGSTAAWGNIGHAQSLGWYAFSQSCQIAKPHFGFANGLSSPCLPRRLHAFSPLCENEILGVLLVLRLAHSPLFAELSNDD